jgi:protein-L-isoaspartate(D-aspartate) O-methyltransferase
MSTTEISDPWRLQRYNMVETQIRDRGVRNKRVLEAMRSIPREGFLPESVREAAYEDRAVPIGQDQTISQPFIVAFMTEQLEVGPEHRVLEIGTGSGYQTAILAQLCRRVYTVERLSSLSERATATLAAMGITNVSYRVGDGSVGWPEEAPFDRILVTAAAPRIPLQLVAQLSPAGRMILPVGSDVDQTISRVYREGSRVIEIPLLACRFVKLIGRDAWPV